MQINIVISMIFSIIIAFFAVQNAEIVTINLLWYKFSLSQAVIILSSALFGVLVMLPFDIFRAVKHKLKLMEMNGEIRRLKEELEKEKVLKAPEQEKEMIPADTTNNEVQ